MVKLIFDIIKKQGNIEFNCRVANFLIDHKSEEITLEYLIQVKFLNKSAFKSLYTSGLTDSNIKKK